MDPVVMLYRNPWKLSLNAEVVLQFLQTAAIAAAERLEELHSEDWPEGRLPPERNSFDAVLLDPTRPHWATSFADRVFAGIVIGPEGRRYLPNGAAKADAHDRHGKENGFLVAHANFCLSDGDFAWGSSAEYMGAIGGGSGLFPSQDQALVMQILEEVMTRVHHARQQMIEEGRRSAGSHNWYGVGNRPADDYASILYRESMVPAGA